MKSLQINSSGKKYILSLAALAILAVIGALVFQVGPFHHKKTLVVSGSSFNTKGEPSKSGSANGQTGNQSSSSTGDGKIAAKPSSTLFTPSGDFVSNHHPNLSGSPAPNTISSVCNTTPGASCKITFTQGDLVKSLSSQTTDANGSTYWSWKLQDVGLTQGTWKIEAVASLNGQTSTASDAMDLVVAQ